MQSKNTVAQEALLFNRSETTERDRLEDLPEYALPIESKPGSGHDQGPVVLSVFALTHHLPDVPRCRCYDLFPAFELGLPKRVNMLVLCHGTPCGTCEVHKYITASDRTRITEYDCTRKPLRQLPKRPSDDAETLTTLKAVGMQGERRTRQDVGAGGEEESLSSMPQQAAALTRAHRTTPDRGSGGYRLEFCARQLRDLLPDRRGCWSSATSRAYSSSPSPLTPPSPSQSDSTPVRTRSAEGGAWGLRPHKGPPGASSPTEPVVGGRGLHADPRDAAPGPSDAGPRHPGAGAGSRGRRRRGTHWERALRDVAHAGSWVEQRVAISASWTQTVRLRNADVGYLSACHRRGCTLDP